MGKKNKEQLQQQAMEIIKESTTISADKIPQSELKSIVIKLACYVKHSHEEVAPFPSRGILVESVLF